MAVPARLSPASSRAQRVELAVYAFAAVSLIVLGVVFQTPVLNWIVGPAYIVSVVTLGTPLALKMARVDQQ